MCWTGTTAAATLGSAPAAGGSAAAGGGLSRTLIIVISVCVTFGGVLLIAFLVWGVVALARRHEDDLPEQETSVAMSGASGGVRHKTINMLMTAFQSMCECFTTAQVA